MPFTTIVQLLKSAGLRLVRLRGRRAGVGAVGGGRSLARAMIFMPVLVGCSSLPVFVPDMSRRDVTPQLTSARGVLSQSQSRAVLERLRAQERAE